MVVWRQDESSLRKYSTLNVNYLKVINVAYKNKLVFPHTFGLPGEFRSTKYVNNIPGRRYSMTVKRKMNIVVYC